jgi:WhiB family redox-sensing transcriptional regulator
MTWLDRAACKGKPSDWFVAERGSRKDRRPPIERRALALCAKCPVSDECLNYALDNEQFQFSVRGNGEEPENVSHWLEGVFAGTTAEDRKATRDMKREQRVPTLKFIAKMRYRQLGLVKEEA